MKKLLTLSLLCVLSTTSLGLIASCGQQRPDTPTIPEEKQFIVTLEGEKQQGQVLTVVVKDESNNALNGSKITITEGDNLITLNGNQLTLNEIGHVKIEVSLQGYKTQTIEFNITEAPLKKLNVEYEGNSFMVKQLQHFLKLNQAKSLQILRSISQKVLHGLSLETLQLVY